MPLRSRPISGNTADLLAHAESVGQPSRFRKDGLATGLERAGADDPAQKLAMPQTPPTLDLKDLPFPLRDYQSEGVAFLAQSESGLLADEMGLGKTVQAILAIRVLRRINQCQRALIVAPRSLCTNWRREFGLWAPNILVRVVEGNASNRKALYHLPIPVLIGTYEQIRSDTDLLDRDTSFDVVVLDEAQRIKDQRSNTSVACRGIPRQRSWALTGTPVENHPNDLISLFTFVRRKLLYRGIAVGELHAQIRPHFLRRTKSEVLSELPPILIQDWSLQLNGEQLAAYQDHWNTRMETLGESARSSGDGHLLALITRLKLLCNRHSPSGESAKLDALNLILENQELPTDKLLLFSQYVETLEWLSKQLEHVPHRLFHGGMKSDQRDMNIRWFREAHGPCLLLVSLKAGGVGLNLQEASTVIMFDRWWNPAVEDQAMQRAHRFGRDRPLHVIRFIVEDTIEERIDTLLREKRQLFTEYIDEAESAPIPRVSHEELRMILGLPRNGTMS